MSKSVFSPLLLQHLPLQLVLTATQTVENLNLEMLNDSRKWLGTHWLMSSARQADAIRFPQLLATAPDAALMKVPFIVCYCHIAAAA